MKKCDCKIMNTLSRYPKVWPWLGVAGYALDGAERGLKHTRWGKMNYKARMLVHGAGAGLLCLGAGVHTAQAAAAGMVNVPAAVTGAVIGTGIVGLNYTHAEAKKIGVKRACAAPRVLRHDRPRHRRARDRRQAPETVRYTAHQTENSHSGSRHCGCCHF